jgi:hypothetical protein
MARNSGGQSFNIALLAGQTITQPGGGTRAYLLIATAPVNMRARGTLYGTDAYTTYQVGQGISKAGDNAIPFDVVDIQNPNNIPVVISVWIGYSDFIDNRLILANASIPQVVNPTYPVPGAALAVQIPDLTGGGFVDVNGKPWLALYRVAILVFNLDHADVYFVQKYGAVNAGDPSVGAVQPLTPVRFDFSGDYTIQQAAAINAIVSEIYAAIPA